MIRVVATSDLHGILSDIPECDLLFIGGDICLDGSSKAQAEWVDLNFRCWLNLGASHGNHCRSWKS
jgi:hypothetical protein